MYEYILQDFLPEYEQSVPTERTVLTRENSCDFCVHGYDRLVALSKSRPNLEGKSDTYKAVMASKMIDEFAIFARHTWIRRLKNVFDYGELIPFLYTSKAITGLCESLEDIETNKDTSDKAQNEFLKKLEAHVRAEEELLPLNVAGVSMGFILEVMIPVGLEDFSQMKEVVSVVMNMLGFGQNSGTFFARHYKKNAGNYIGIFITPRTELEERREIVVSRANKARYRSSVTGKMCHKFSKGAVKVCEKGDVLKTMMSDFSEMTDFMDLSPKKFKEQMALTKSVLSELYDELGFADQKTIILGEYDGNCEKWTDFNRKVIRWYNEMFRDLEEDLSNIYRWIKSLNSDSFMSGFNVLVTQLRRAQRRVVTEKEDIDDYDDIYVRFDRPFRRSQEGVKFFEKQLRSYITRFVKSVELCL